MRRQDRQGPCPGGQRTMVAAAGAPTALACGFGASSHKRPRLPAPDAPWGVTVVRDIDCCRSGAAATATWSTARAPAPCGIARCHRVSCQGTVAVGATAPAAPEGVNRPGSGHPQTRAEPPRSSRPRAGASSVHPAAPCARKSPGGTRRVSAVPGLGSPSHGAPSPPMHPVPPAEREALSPSSAHRSGAAR